MTRTGGIMRCTGVSRPCWYEYICICICIYLQVCTDIACWPCRYWRIKNLYMSLSEYANKYKYPAMYTYGHLSTRMTPWPKIELPNKSNHYMSTCQHNMILTHIRTHIHIHAGPAARRQCNTEAKKPAKIRIPDARPAQNTSGPQRGQTSTSTSTLSSRDARNIRE